MSKIPTAEEYLEDNYTPYYDEDNDPIYHVWQIKKAIIEFAKLHVKAALKEASEKCIIEDDAISKKIVKESILNSYPLKNIK